MQAQLRQLPTQFTACSVLLLILLSAGADLQDGLIGAHGATVDGKERVLYPIKVEIGSAKRSGSRDAPGGIGHSLEIDEEMAGNIISKGAHNHAHPRRERHNQAHAKRLHWRPQTQSVPSPAHIWPSDWEKIEVCDDSCDASRNGVCDDGRLGGGSVGEGQSKKDIHKPIKSLREAEILVMTHKTATYPSFLMPYTDPAKDVDVSGQMAHRQVVELGLTQAMHVAMRGKCTGTKPDPAIFLDIGSNFGWYAFFAAAHGCRVIAWEPVPHFRDFLIYGQQLNAMEDLIAIRENVVSDVAGKEVEMTVPGRGIWGTASVDQLNIDPGIPDPDRKTVKVATERADGVMQGDVLLAKIDVEGFEPQAMRSLKTLFEKFRIENIFMEYSPGIYERHSRWRELSEFPNMLAKLLSHDYKIAHFDDGITRGHSLLKSEDWSDSLPELAEVTKQNVGYDLVDCYKLSQRHLTDCWSPGLGKVNNLWQSCFLLPEDLHPKAFRAYFGYNTNIWATLDPDNFKVNRAASIFPLDADPADWFVSKDQFSLGLGNRMCVHIGDQLKLKSHCPCLTPACEEEARRLDELMKKDGPMTEQHKGVLAKALRHLGAWGSQ